MRLLHIFAPVHLSVVQPHKIRGDGLRSHDLIFDFRVCRFDIGDGSRGLVEIDQYRAVGYLLYELRQGRYGALARIWGDCAAVRSCGVPGLAPITVAPAMSTAMVVRAR